ncbi:hypothetical protein NUW58_g5669 [Xylaria curta]|uniref:Uncharacterized protein n=1 Tax=Xylaria curta TaxID=42375 RepID=A0ACC1P243_9PEZI|nr:hypothetical protein NUW58_g5669 [Xylaria curta]
MHKWANVSKDKWVRLVGIATGIEPITLNNGTKLGMTGLELTAQLQPLYENAFAHYAAQFKAYRPKKPVPVTALLSTKARTKGGMGDFGIRTLFMIFG